MKSFHCLLSICLSFSAALGQHYPFPQHVKYAAGSIKPDVVSQSQLDIAVQNFYDKWKKRYLKRGCDTTQYYVWYNDLGYDGNELCVSEGLGYGMVIVAEMAGYDNAAKQYFDGLYRWYKAHPSSINPLLMNWRQNKNCKSDGDDSATDGDEDIAFGLLLADKQWGSIGEINYIEEAKKLINAIMQSEVFTQSSHALQLGDWSHTSSKYKDGTRPSDFMLDHLRCFKAATNNHNWNKVLSTCYDLIDSMQINYSSVTGLMPDFIQHTDTKSAPATPKYLESKWDGNYNYNSCRTPWRFACDFLLNENKHSKKACDKMNAWIKTSAGNNPKNIKSGYYLNGTPLPKSNYEDLSFIAPFGVSAMVNKDNQAWLDDLWNYIVGVTNLNRDGYFGNTIKMQCLIIMSGNWWAPNIMSPIANPIAEQDKRKISDAKSEMAYALHN